MTSFFSSRAQLFCLILLFLSMLPAWGQLSIALLFSSGIGVVLHRQIKQKAVIRWVVLLTLLSICLVLIQFNDNGWLTAETVLSVLYIVLILKWAESDSSREFRVVALASTLVAALSSLYLPSLPSMVFLLMIAVLVLTCLITISDFEQRLSTGQLIKKSSLISLGLLPVTVVLFVTMPRVQGPLWDIGLAIGLPIELAIDKNAQDISLKGSLRAGEISRLKRSDAPVLVAEFSGSVPYKSRMYWRGPVFSDYDGISWNLPENWDKRSNLLRGSYRGKGAVDAVLTSKRDKVHYEARVSSHAGHWLYALDMPSGQTPEALISKDMQLLGIRKISWEFKYDLNAWLEYTGGRRPSEQEFKAYLAFPETSNPRLKAFGEELAVKYGTAQERIDVLYTHLASMGYQMSLTSDIEEGRNSLDQYFFEEKTGTIEHLASSTALVLRAAGIPARLITGYRGGSLIALTDFVVVKQEHAHVWVEAWSDDLGWQRIEAKDLVVPPENNSQLVQKTAQKTAEKKPTKREVASSSPASAPAAVAEPKKPKNSSKNKQNSTNWGWLKKLSSGMETWVLNYNPERQTELLKKSGLRKVDWKNLLALSAFALAVLAAIYMLFLQVRKPKRDPVTRSFTQLNNCFAKMGLACGEGECPSQWLLRIKTEKPELYPGLQQVVNQYLAVRYGQQNTAQGRAQFVRDVKRLVAMI